MTPTRRLASTLAAAAAAAASIGAAAPNAPATATPPPTAAAPAPTHVLRPHTTAATSPAALALRSTLLRTLWTSTARTIGARVDIDGVGTVLEDHGSTPLAPASTEKTFTTGTALLTMGPTARFRTVVRVEGSQSANGVVDGRVVLVGGGDPTLTRTQLARAAAAIHAQGITRVTGGIVVDATRYDHQPTASGWKPDFMPGESGPLSAIVVDGNTYSRAAVQHPALAAGALLRTLFTAAHVRVDGTVTEATIPTTPQPTITQQNVWSPPLASIVSATLHDSINMYAEQLLKELGARAGAGSSAAGVSAIREEGKALGVGITTTLADGSGLSGLDRQTVDTEVGWLDAIAASPVASTFRMALPVACHSGTLRYRMCHTTASGRVWAKTGTLNGVRCLAGYTRTRSGKPVTFAILLSGVSDSGRALAAIDRAVTAITASTA